MKFHRIIIFIFSITSIVAFSGNKDSLLKEIKSPATNDTSRFNALYELAWDMMYSGTDSTYTLAKEASLLVKRSKDKKKLTKLFNLFGAYFQVKSDYSQAIEFYQKSLKIGEELKDPDAMLVAYSNIGALYIHLSQNKKGLEYQFKSLGIALKYNKKEKLGSIYNNLSLLSGNSGEHQKSIEYALKSLDLFKQFNDKNGICSVMGNLGNAYMSIKKVDDALKSFMECYNLAGEIDNPFERSKAAVDIGEIYLQRESYKEALGYFNEAIQIGKEIEDNITVRDAYEGLYRCYRKQSNTTKALESFEQFYEFTKILNQEEKEEAVNKKEMEFEFNKRAVRDSIKNAEESKVKDVLLYANKTQIEKDKILKIVLTVGLVLVIGFGVLIFNRFRITRKQKHIIEVKNRQTEEQKAIIENKNKEILDSISYARRIQYALLANEEFLAENIPQHFVLYKPKDIVSGDYYWAAKKDHLFYIACCDSTGHGVPGAFMSLLNIGFLSEAINEKNITAPNEVFNYARKRLISSISREDQKDGFDGVLLCINQKDQSITYAGANSAPLLVSNNAIADTSYDKMPVGKGESEQSFTLYTLVARPGDVLYLFTDGYADQFGGPKGKKFKNKQLEELLLANHNQAMETQKSTIEKVFMDWKDELEQIDDVLVIGIKL